MELKTHSQVESKRAAIVREMQEHVIGAQSAKTFEEALHILALRIRLAIGAHQCAISYVPHGDFQAAIHTHSFSEKYEKYNTYDVMPTGGGIWGLVVQQKNAVRMTQEELVSHPMWKNFSALMDKRGLEHPPMRGWLAAPVIRQTGEILGVLQLSDKLDDADFTAKDLELLVHLTYMVLPTFELRYVNQQLRENVKERRRAEEMFRLVVESTSNALLIINCQGQITFVNQQAEKMFGYAPAELLGQRVELLVPERFRERHADYVGSFVKDPTVRSMGVGRDLSGCRKDGSEFPVEIGLTPIETGEGFCVLSAILDITGRKQAEALLAKRASELQAQRMAALNLAADAEEARKLAERNYQAALRANEALQREITDRQQAEAALRRSEEFNRSLIDSSQDCIKTLDLQGHLLSMSSGGQRLLEITDLGPLLQKSWIDFWNEADRPRVAEAVAAAATGAVGRFQAFCPSRSGQPRWWDVIVSPVYGAGSQIERLLSVSREVTEQKQAEEHISQLNAELEQRVQDRTAQLEAANKELEAFSYSVSHDLRAPLRAIDGFSRILLEEYAPLLPDDGQRYLRLARENTQRMGQLIDDLLAFSRLGRQQMQKKSVAPTALVRAVLADLHDETAGRQVEVVLGELCTCQADPALLKQVFTNLLANAFKFTRTHPAARIEIGCRPVEPPGQNTYFVKDNGAGFDMQYAHKLFDVFQRLHRAEDYPGTGVGLAIVQRIIHRHGGRVWAEGAVNHGATFYFTLSQGVDS